MATAERRQDLKRMEAQELYQKAEGLTKKTLTRWKPDWDGAAQGFDKAATAFKLAGDIDRAVDSCKRGSECWYKQENLFLAGKSMESAAVMVRDNDPATAAKYFSNASQMYQENGQSEKAAEMLGKGASSLAEKDAASAVAMYRQSVDLYIEIGKEIYSNDIFRKCITLMVREGMVADAIPLLKKHADVLSRLNSASFQHKAYLSIVVLRLHLKDHVGAEKDFEEAVAACPSFSSSDEWFTANMLLDAWDKGDTEKFQEVCSRQIFTFLENPIARIAKKLQCPADKDEEPGGGIV